ncbi:MAG TPA: four helix bundle protein [Tepidiformaceae bacterium]|nr:four helix bundle protein [Tepidiformaceae bacterium]
MQLGLGVIGLVDNLPKNRTCDVIGRQLLRCATSVGANYRASCRARSFEEVISKLSIVEEEADETMYWLELLEQSKQAQQSDLRQLQQEASEILAMTVASKKTLKARIGSPSFANPRPRRMGNRES